MGVFSKKTDARHGDDRIASVASSHTATAPEVDQRDMTEKEVVRANDEVERQPRLSDEIDPIIEQRLLRKLDMYLTPLVALLFLLAFLDRSNIGNARIAGMSTDLHLTSSDYDWLLTIFYISYIIFQVLGFMWRIMKPHNWCFIIVLFWGIVATCQAATQNWSGMMALRFLLGGAEAGFGPSVPFLLSFFYRRHELGFRCGMFLSAAPLANTFAGALAYGITSGHAHIANWRLLFLVEGLPTIVMAFVAWYFLPDGPHQARYLTAEEKEVARRRAMRQHGSSAEERTETTGTGIKWNEIAETLVQPIPWFTALMYFSLNVSYSSLPVFLPTILSEMGFSSINAQGLSAPPYFVSFLITILSTWIADRTAQRGIMIATLSIIGGVGYILLATCTSVAPRYFGVYLAAAGIFPAIGNVLPWVLNNQGSDTRRGTGIILLNLVGQCGPLLGTRVFPTSQAPFYVKGQSICAAFLFFNALLAICLRTLLVYENKKLDRKYNNSTDEKEDGQENYGRSFRYVL